MLLAGKKGVVLNVTNEKSIGWAIADQANRHGAEVIIGAQNEKIAEKVSRLLEGRQGLTMVQVDFQNESDMASLAGKVAQQLGHIDFFVHSAAYGNKEDLQGRFVETSRSGFLLSMDVSAYSLVETCRVLEPLMNDDGSVIALSYLGATRAVGNYNVMGVAKAALEACARYLAVDLGHRGIRVNVLSPGPVNTISARGVKGLIDMLDFVQEKAPLKRPYGQDEVGSNALYLLSDLSQGVTGQIIFIDSGYNIVGV